MATSPMTKVIANLRKTLLQRDYVSLTDGQLLASFLKHRDEGAFEALVRRHGPTVLGVCRRVVGNVHDADDAFQATFLVLLRRATDIGSRELVGNWLYGVAYRTALKAKALNVRRQAKERPGQDMLDPLVEPREFWQDLQPILDEELNRLPDKYRAPILLCDLQGTPQRQAARLLSLPVGTLAYRLSAGRRILAKRLTQRGLVLSGIALAVALSQKAASAGVSPGLVASTVKVATTLAANPAAWVSVVSPKVVFLTEGVLKAMYLTKLKTAMTVLFVVAVILLAAGGLHFQAAPITSQVQPATTKDAGRSAPVQPAQTKDQGPSSPVQPATANDVGPSPPTQAVDAPKWEPMVAALAKDSGLCGIVVDHKTGCVWINVIGKGVYCSGAGAKSFKVVKGYHLSGHNETPGCWLLDPTGKSQRAITALISGCQCSFSLDHLATWTCMDVQSKHMNWCAVDWTDPDMKFVLALKHDSQGLLLASRDGGKTFAEVGRGYGTGWVFDGQTAVVAQAKDNKRPTQSLLRTTDGGKTFERCGQYSPVGTDSGQALPRWHDGVLYWLVEGGLIATADKGASWTKVSGIDGQYGPVFGKNAKHMFVLTHSGIVESTDGGVNWSKPIPPPKEMKGISALTWIDYDPTLDVLYLMKQGSDLYKLAREK
jgi:RNA polymerase sigma factor (sigma-70 family)